MHHFSAVNKSGQTVVATTNVRFSCHCFTEKFVEGDHAEELTFWDDKRKRALSEQRHKLSMYLPEIIHNLGDKRVFQTCYENYLYFEIAKSLASGEHYHLFFTLKRTRDPGQKLELFIESAYSKPIDLRGATALRFSVLLLNALEGKKIRPHPRR